VDSWRAGQRGTKAGLNGKVDKVVQVCKKVLYSLVHLIHLSSEAGQAGQGGTASLGQGGKVEREVERELSTLSYPLRGYDKVDSVYKLGLVQETKLYPLST
jgi:hypothetical protein